MKKPRAFKRVALELIYALLSAPLCITVALVGFLAREVIYDFLSGWEVARLVREWFLDPDYRP